MFKLVSGDLFQSSAVALVNTVNCVGVMGKGIALAFKTRYPEIMGPYKAACQNKTLFPGTMQFLQMEDGKWVVNFPTKIDWRNPSELSWIEAGLPALRDGLIERNIPSVAIPALGSTNGGLNFDLVVPLVENTFKDVSSIDAELYRPQTQSPSNYQDDPILNFGKHKGQKLSQVPQSYVRWLAENAFDQNIKIAAGKMTNPF